MHRARNLRQTLFCLFLLLPFFGGLQGAFADAQSFVTKEYEQSTGLASIHAAEAYARGFTGKGVTVAVCDAPFASEQGEFLAKYPLGIFWSQSHKANNSHGIHVAGIIAAAKNDFGMHGIAFDATLLPVETGYGLPPDMPEPKELVVQTVTLPLWRRLLDYPRVRIVNNSWGENFFLDQDKSEPYSPGFLKRFAAKPLHREWVGVANDLARQDKLLIMAAGNEGHLSPSTTGALPSFLDSIGAAHSLSNNWISVSAYDPRYPTSSPAFVAFFTNTGLHAAEYTLFAPGFDIYSTVSPSTFGFSKGTSMAAPYVSGAAALVQQAFPYMGGKQIADVLLSTATPITGSARPKAILQRREEFGEAGNPSRSVNFTIVAPRGFTPSALSARDKADLTALIRTASGNLSVDAAAAMRDNLLQRPMLLDEAEYAQLFGQGILNVAKAVRGPGYLNAQRLSAAKDLSRGKFGGDFALYTVDTKGFESVWSNNVGERRATSGALTGLGVGLRKDGAGILHLTGANTYTGPTVVRGGGISLGWPGASRKAVIAGDVHVRGKALFTGAGTVRGSLYSAGTLLPGLEQKPGKTLYVQKSATSTGRLAVVLGQSGKANRLHVGKALDIRKSGLRLVNSSRESIEPYEDYKNVLRADGGIVYSKHFPERYDHSAFLSYTLRRTKNTLSLLAETRDLDTLPGVPGATRAVTKALKHMYTSLEGTAAQDDMDFLYSMQRGEYLDAAAAMRGDIHAATFTNLPFSGVLNRLVMGNPLARAKKAPQEPGTTASGGAGRGSLWMRPVIGYAKAKGRGDLGQSSLATHARGLALGVQYGSDELFGGLVFALGDGDIEQGGAQADITDARLGIYAGHASGPLQLGTIFSGGWQHYKTQRLVPVSHGRDEMESSFDGCAFGLGVEASYNLLHGRADTVAIKPYAGLDADYIYQEGRKETGNRTFGLDVHSKDLWRTALRAGLAADVAPLDWLTLSASGGYKRLLSGHRPNMDVGFRGNTSYRFNAISPDEGRDYLTYGLDATAALPRNLSLKAGFFGEQSKKTRSYNGYLSLQLAW